MKRFLVLAFIALLIAPAAAFAETDGFWTVNADWYYHASEYCGGVEGMVPISPEGAEAFAKYPCPVCVSTQESDEIRAAVIFGQLVLRIPDAWLAGLEYESREAERLERNGAEAWRALGIYLHGEDYVRFLADLRERRSAGATGMFPWLIELNQVKPLSMRHIGDAWYACVRPLEDPADGIQVLLDVSRFDLRMEGDSLEMESALEYMEPLSLSQMESIPAASYIYLREGEGVRVYRALDAYFLDFFTEVGEYVEFPRLYIDGADLNVALAAWRSGDIADYGCVLTEAEFRALESGATLELIDDSNGNRIAFSGDAE